jgi:hypothetical protein
MKAIWGFFNKLVRLYKAAKHEWIFGGPVEGYLGEYSQQPFRICPLIGKEPYGHGGHIKYGGMLPSYYGEEIYNDGKVSFKLKKHAIDKYGRVRYFDEVPEDYVDVIEHHRMYDKDNIINVYARKKPKWEYAGFLSEDDQENLP